jgi:hypothetical protein
MHVADNPELTYVKGRLSVPPFISRLKARDSRLEAKERRRMARHVMRGVEADVFSGETIRGLFESGIFARWFLPGFSPARIITDRP